MTAFTYKALRPDGTLSSGSLDAGGRQDALRALDQQGLQLVELTEGRAAAASQANQKGVKAKVLENFTRQLASLLAASVPLSQALHLLSHESDEAGREHWQAVYKEIVDGSSLSHAMSLLPHVFPRVYVAMVNAGETGGFLDLVLRQIADFQNRDRELRSRVYGALIYPAVLAVLAVLVVIFLMTFFIPRFQGIFSDFGGALPPLTQAIVSTSQFMTDYGLFAVLAAAAAGLSLHRFLKSPAGRRHWEAFILKIPVIGDVAARFAMTRFCRMLGTLTHAGVPLINALRVARESLGNETLADMVDQAIDRVQHGDRLGTSLATCPALFPPAVIAMVTVAEQSGRLDEELIRLANDSEEELDRRLRAAVALAEPILLFIMAGFVGTIVIGMVLPIFSIQDYIK